jgi:hypothetical protein
MYGFVFALDLVVNVRIDFVGIDIDYEFVVNSRAMCMARNDFVFVVVVE